MFFKLVIRRALLSSALVASFLALVTPSPARAVNFVYHGSCTVPMQQSITAALQAAANPTQQARNYVANLPTNPGLFQTWFGRMAASQTVLNIYNNVLGLMQNNSNMGVFCNNTGNVNVAGQTWSACGNEFAASMYQVAALQICPNFFGRPLTGLDSRAGIIIHEFTHITDNTEDHAYGCQGARGNAISPPFQRSNADNYEYMAEIGAMGAVCP